MFSPVRDVEGPVVPGTAHLGPVQETLAERAAPVGATVGEGVEASRPR